MSSSTSSDALLRAIVDRRNLHDAIRSDLVPSNDDLFQGAGFMRGSPVLDFHTWKDDLRGEIDYLAVTAEVRERLDHCRSHFRIADLRAALEVCERDRRASWAKRLLVYLACLGDVAARQRLAHVIAAERMPAKVWCWTAATVYGLVHSDAALKSMSDYCDFGLERLGAIAEELRQVQDIEAGVDGTTYDGEEEPTAGDDLLRKLKRSHGPGVVVVPAFEKPATGERSKPRQAAHVIAGKKLPLIATGDVRQHQLALEAMAPHLSGVYLTLLGDTAMSPHVALRPTILVGAKGAGKSWAAAQLAEAFSLPFSMFDASSSADGTFGGTAAHWSTSGICEPLRVVRDTAVANPMVIIEEIEKASTSPYNGSLHRALLLFTEKETSRRFRDPALELNVDLSHVNYVMTANDLQGIPGPLLDRCRIIEVPAPEWQHVGPIVKGIVEKIRRGVVDPRLVPDLAPDEIDAIARQWRGGSLRRLRDITTAYVQRGSLGMGRA